MLKLYGFNEGIQIIAHAYPIKHLSLDSDADADLVKIYGLTWMKYLWIRTSLVTMHAPWVVHTTAVGQRRRNYDVTIARHQTLRSHAWRITGGSRHALTLQYLDKTDSAVFSVCINESNSYQAKNLWWIGQFMSVWSDIVLLRYAKYCFRTINNTINQNYRDKRYGTIIL